LETKIREENKWFSRHNSRKKMKHNVRHQFYGHIAPHTVQHCRKEFQHKLDMSARQMDLAQVAPEIRIIDNNGKQ